MTPSAKSQLPQAALATARVDWSQWDPWAGFQGLMGVALCLGLGFFLHHSTSGAIAAGGALYIGLGSFDKHTRTSTSFMSTGSLLISLAAWSGSLCGHHLGSITLFACLWAFVAGWLSLLGPPLSFIGLKTLVTFLIAGGYPANATDALHRGLLILGGALFQTLLFSLETSFLQRWGAPHRRFFPQPIWRKSWKTIRTHFHPRSAAFQHALRLAICICLAQAVCRSLLTYNSYWLPLTVAIVMRPDFEQTLVRGFSRMVGTVIGACLTTLIVIWLKPSGIALAFLTLPCAWLCFSLFKASYALYSICITAYIVFMLSFVGLPEISILMNRLIATLAGGSFALLVYALWPWPKTSS